MKHYVKYAICLFILLVSSISFGWEPPTPTGYVVDTANKLTLSQINALNSKIEGYHKEDSSQIAVLILTSLEGQSIEDVAYKTFNTWKIGNKEKDNGVLLVLAIKERKSRIETGKGIGDKITDLQSNDILRNVLAPRLKVRDFYGGINSTVEHIYSLIKVETIVDNSSTQQVQQSIKQPVNDNNDGLLIAFAILGVGIIGLILYFIFKSDEDEEQTYSSYSNYNPPSPSFTSKTVPQSNQQVSNTSSSTYVYVAPPVYSPPVYSTYTPPAPKSSSKSVWDSGSSSSSSSSDSGSFGGFDGGSSGGGGSTSGDW